MNVKLLCATTVLLIAISNAADAGPHCRFGPGSHKWEVFPTKVDGFLTGTGRNYEIRGAYGSATYDIQIASDDRFFMEKLLDDRIALKHMRKNALTGLYTIEVGFGTLAVDGSNLWARGPAHLPSGKVVGEYMIFRTPDSGQAGQPDCTHDRRPVGSKCPTMHFEFFDDDDGGSFVHKPEIGRNVMSTYTDCRSPDAEAGDGDGDEGPDA